MSKHALIDLSNERQVKQAKEFKLAAAELSGEKLDVLYRQEVENAPNRHAEDKKYLGVKTVRTPKARQAGKDDRHFALAVGAWAAGGGEGPELPGHDGAVVILDSLVPLRTAAPDRDKGDADPNKGVDDIDLLVLLPDDRMAVVCTKYLAPDANRGGAGDTPLRALLRGLAQTAMVDANRATLGEEIQEATGRALSEEAPALILAATPRYWELCRKREAQKGAAWIRELERLAREIPQEIGVEVFYVAAELEGNPGWSYDDSGPVLDAAMVWATPWEPGAGKLKPKPRPRKRDPVVELIEADPSRPPKSYSIHSSYEAGDLIEHSKLGDGVVQGTVGVGKIHVLFGEEMKTLVHERAPAAGA